MPSKLSRRALLSSLVAAGGGVGALVAAPSAASGADRSADPGQEHGDPPVPTGLAVRPARYQVSGLDNSGDNTAALVRAFASASPGDEIVIPPGDWPHSSTIQLAVSGITIEGYGARLLATDPRHAGLHITGSQVTVAGLTHKVVGATQRGNGENIDDCPFSIDGASDVVLQDVVSIGARDAGVFLFGAQRARLVNVQVRDSLADGIHVTYGSAGCVIEAPVVLSPGDDGVAVVSYSADPVVCSDIRIAGPLVVDGAARGVAISGGDRVVITGVDVRRSRGSGVYVASEQGQFTTAPVTSCRISGGTVDDANWDPTLDTGNVGVFQLAPGTTTSDVIIEALTVTGSQKAPGPYIKIGTANGAGGRFDGLRLRDIVLPGGSVYLDGGNAVSTQVDRYSLATTSAGTTDRDTTTVTAGPAATGNGITLARIRR